MHFHSSMMLYCRRVLMTNLLQRGTVSKHTQVSPRNPRLATCKYILFCIVERFGDRYLLIRLYLILQNKLNYSFRDHNNPNFAVSEKDIKCFMGILLLSGYPTLPQQQHYWSKQPDLEVPLVSYRMSKNRFS